MFTFSNENYERDVRRRDINDHSRAITAIIENDDDEMYYLVGNGLLDTTAATYINNAIICGNLDMVVFLHEQGFMHNHRSRVLAISSGYSCIAEYVNNNFI